MKLCNIIMEGETHLAVQTDAGVLDLTAAGFPMDMDALIATGSGAAAAHFLAEKALPAVEKPVYANVVNQTGKLVCVGFNYADHAKGLDTKLPQYPILFSKFANALAPHEAQVSLPDWEVSYDYEAELVVVMGKATWNVSEEEAMDHVFGYTCGNDFSCRDPQMRSGQFLIGKTMPGFGPCGPVIVTADCFDPFQPMAIRSYVNGELRQDGNTTQMIFDCAKLISYASRYIALEPGDLIYTGTPSGVALEKKDGSRRWLVPGDRVDVEIEGIGTLTSYMV